MSRANSRKARSAASRSVFGRRVDGDPERGVGPPQQASHARVRAWSARRWPSERSPSQYQCHTQQPSAARGPRSSPMRTGLATPDSPGGRLGACHAPSASTSRWSSSPAGWPSLPTWAVCVWCRYAATNSATAARPSDRRTSALLLTALEVRRPAREAVVAPRPTRPPARGATIAIGPAATAPAASAHGRAPATPRPPTPTAASGDGRRRLHGRLAAPAQAATASSVSSRQRAPSQYMQQHDRAEEHPTEDDVIVVGHQAVVAQVPDHHDRGRRAASWRAIGTTIDARDERDPPPGRAVDQPRVERPDHDRRDQELDAAAGLDDRPLPGRNDEVHAFAVHRHAGELQRRRP